MVDVFFDRWWRVAGVAGIIFVILAVAGGAVTGDTPTFDEPTDKIRDWFADNGDQFVVGSFLISIAFAFFFFPFIAGLRSLLAAAEGGPRMWSTVSFAGGVAFLVIGAAVSLFWTSLAFSLGVVEQGDEVPIKGIMYLDAVGTAMLTAPLIPLVLGASLVSLRTGVLWRWLAVIALLAIVFDVINTANVLSSDADGALGGVGFLGIVATALWILLVGVNMLLKSEEPAAAA
jgi:hypothetical protein